MIRNVPAVAILIALCLPCSARAEDALPFRTTNVFLSYGASQKNWHGQAKFRAVTVERFGFAPRLVTRWLPKFRAGASLTYSDVVQPRSWFGHEYGDPDDHVRAEWAYFFVRREWHEGAAVHPYLDLGTGPMWSNRRIPAATSRLNFQSQLGLGLAFRAPGGEPLYVSYRFGHISNGMLGPRNPGWNVHSMLIGARVGR